MHAIHRLRLVLRGRQAHAIQTRIYRLGTIGAMEIRLRLSSTTAGKPVLASVSKPINSLP